MDRKTLLRGLFLFGSVAFAFFVSVYLATLFIEGPGGGDKIALIRIEGVILDSQVTLSELNKYKENPSIKAILLRIDSPGGAVVPSQEIYEEVLRIRREGKTKVVASMGNIAASGGYYIAAASEKIVANPGTLTGSIGVIMELANLEGLLQKLGVESVVIKSGSHKGMGSPLRKMTEEERTLLQKLLDDVHTQFIQSVAQGRGLSEEKIRPLADGRVFTGRQAKEIGLVDEVGDLREAIKIAAELSGIKGEPRVIESRKPFSLLGFFRTRIVGENFPFPLSYAPIQLKFLLAF